MARDLDVQHKTAWIMCHKLREAMGMGNDDVVLSGDVEIDGCHVGGHVRTENRKEDRKDRRLAENKDADRRVVIALRERQGRTLTFVEKREANVVQHVLARVGEHSVLHVDEASHWDVLHALYTTTRINHSEAYSDGYACTNQVESFFSRLRRMVRGQHHFVSPQYLHQYSTEAAWREDTRRTDNKAALGEVDGRCAHGSCIAQLGWLLAARGRVIEKKPRSRARHTRFLRRQNMSNKASGFSREPPCRPRQNNRYNSLRICK